MAGSSSPYNVDNITFSSINSAITQIIADEDGNDTVEEIVIAYTFSTAETVNLPTNAQVKTTGQFPLRISGDGATTLTGYILYGASGNRHLVINDTIIVSAGANWSINGGNAVTNQSLLVTDCEITNTSQKNIGEIGRLFSSGTSYGNTSVKPNIGRCGFVSLYGCKLDSAIGNVSVDLGNHGLYFENSAMNSTGAYNINNGTSVANSCVALSCTFAQATAVYRSDVTADTTEGIVRMIGCVFDNFSHVIHYPTAIDTELLRYPNSPMFTRDCIVSNQTGTAYLSMLNTSQQMTLAALQTAGMDSGSKAFNVTFTSTTLSSADFLKHDSGDNADLLFADPTGVNTDFFGTARTSGPISAGIFEPSAVAPSGVRVWGEGSGAGTDGLYSTAANWTDDIKPIAGDTARFNGGVVIDCRLDESIVAGVNIDMQTAYTGHISGATDNLAHAALDVTLDGTTFSMGDGDWTVSGNLDNEDVTTFNQNSSTLIMDGIGKTILSSTNNNVNNFTVSGTITQITNRMQTRGALSIPVGGVFTINALHDAFATVSVAGILVGSNKFVFQKVASTILNTGTFNPSTVTATGGVTLVAGTYGGTWLIDRNGSGGMITFTITGDAIFTGAVTYKNDETGAGRSYTIDHQGNTITYQDDVTYTIAGGTQLLVIDNTGNPSYIYQGNVTFIEGAGTLTYTKGTGDITFSPTSGTKVLTSLNKSLEGIVVNAPGATIQLADNLTTDSIIHQDGNVDYNGKTVTSPNFSACHPGTTADMTGVALVVSDDLAVVGEADSHYLFKGTGSWTMNVTGEAAALNADVGFCDASAGSEFEVFNGTNSGNNINVAFAICDHAAESDVRLGIIYDDTAKTGTLDLPAEEDVELGVVFDNATKTGTFAGTPPTAPTLAVTDKADGTGVSYTVSGADAGTTNETFFFEDAVGVVTATLGDTIVGNSSGSISITIAATYWFYTITTGAGGSEISNIVRVDVTDLGETTDSSEANLISCNGEDTTIQQVSATATASGSRSPSWTTVDTVKVWIQTTSSNLRTQYALRQIVVTHKGLVAEDLGLTEGDRIIQLGVNYLVRGFTDQGGLGRVWRIDIEEVF